MELQIMLKEGKLRDKMTRQMRKDMTQIEKAVHLHLEGICDYCTNPEMVKVTIHNHYWKLCYDCAIEHAERLMLDVGEVHKLAKKHGIKLHSDSE